MSCAASEERQTLTVLRVAQLKTFTLGLRARRWEFLNLSLLLLLSMCEWWKEGKEKANSHTYWGAWRWTDLETPPRAVLNWISLMGRFCSLWYPNSNSCYNVYPATPEWKGWIYSSYETSRLKRTSWLASLQHALHVAKKPHQLGLVTLLANIHMPWNFINKENWPCFFTLVQNIIYFLSMFAFLRDVAMRQRVTEVKATANMWISSCHGVL